MSKKKSRFFICLLAVILCMAAFSTVAYASGGEEVTPTPTATPQPSPNPFTPDGTGTVLDNATGEDGKEFFTITTPDKHVFYLIIDRQKDSNNVYFLDAVTEKDLLALAEATEDGENAAPTQQPEPTTKPTPQPEQNPQPEPGQKSNMGGIIAVVLIIAVIIGGAVYFFKFRKPKQSAKGKTNLDEYDFDEDEDANTGGEDTDTEDDAAYLDESGDTGEEKDDA